MMDGSDYVVKTSTVARVARAVLATGDKQLARRLRAFLAQTPRASNYCISILLDMETGTRSLRVAPGPAVPFGTTTPRTFLEHARLPGLRKHHHLQLSFAQTAALATLFCATPEGRKYHRRQCSFTVRFAEHPQVCFFDPPTPSTHEDEDEESVPAEQMFSLDDVYGGGSGSGEEGEDDVMIMIENDMGRMLS